VENKWQLHLNDMNSASSTLVPSSGIVLLDLIPFFWGGGFQTGVLVERS